MNYFTGSIQSGLSAALDEQLLFCGNIFPTKRCNGSMTNTSAGNEKAARETQTPSTTTTESRVVFKSGASRSEYKPAYHQIPSSALRRLAQRYDLGVEKHGRHNWLKGGTELHYLTQVFDHALDHLMRYRDGIDPSDDHLAAAMWGIAALCEFEERGHCRPGLLGLPTDDDLRKDSTTP
jgi:hypothetical protein